MSKQRDERIRQRQLRNEQIRRSKLRFELDKELPKGRVLEQRHLEQSGTRQAAVEGALMGFGAGLIVPSLLVFVGIILCLTIIGAVIGIPMIIVGIILMIVGPFFGLAMGSTSIKGLCPYCRGKVLALPTTPGVNCPACTKRIVIRNKRFYRVD